MNKFSQQEIEELCSKDYESVVGKVILVTQIECFDQNEDSVTVYCDPPAIARIEAYEGGSHDQCVIRWMDDEHCDPVYDISILEPHQAFELANARPSWIYGTCRSTDGKIEAAPFALADEKTQDAYRHVEPVYYLEIGPRDNSPIPSRGF
jgi:hypothetical protein